MAQPHPTRPDCLEFSDEDLARLRGAAALSERHEHELRIAISSARDPGSLWLADRRTLMSIARGLREAASIVDDVVGKRDKGADR